MIEQLATYGGPLLTGIAVGAVFALLDFPVPAPPKAAGVIGIAGIYLGFKIVQYIL